MLKKFKDKLYNFFVLKNSHITAEYTSYVNANIDIHNSKRYQHWWRLFRLNFYYRVLHGKPYLYGSPNSASSTDKIRYYMPDFQRLSLDELCEQAMPYDVISLDIFDTALYRTVKKPSDVFSIMAIEMGSYSFENDRQNAERVARMHKERTQFTREVTLEEIYTVLHDRYSIDARWMEREIEIELEICRPNPYIFSFYQKMLSLGKEIVFTSDMYLPASALKAMLAKCGYTTYSKIFLSNEYLLCKGEGTLQKVLLEELSGKKILHIGDNQVGDYEKTLEADIDAVYNPKVELVELGSDMENLGGSFFSSIVNNQIAGGMWDHNIYYEHGFRVGGILTAGFCKYINELARKKHVDKIIFCARDCEVIWKVYNQFYKQFDNEYMEISRRAILSASGEKYLHDLSSRYILRYFDLFKTKKTVGSILEECGYDYLVSYLEEADIDQYLFPCALDRRKMEAFIFSQAKRILEHNAEHIAASKKYYSDLIGNAQRVLVVDIGWSGSCITVFKGFVHEYLANKRCEIFGALMCTSRSKTLVNSMEDGTVNAYVYSPFSDMDLTRTVMPMGKSARDTRLQDRLHMPLENLFTSVNPSLLSYGFGKTGQIIFHRSSRECVNPEEICEMQAGIIDFNKILCNNTAFLNHDLYISPYVAFNPLKNALKQTRYLQAVYGNFAYDAMTPTYSKDLSTPRFQQLIDYTNTGVASSATNGKGSILFVTPELIFTGAPRSMLRMCKVAIGLGYHVAVWSATNGPFASEFEKNGIAIRIVPEQDLGKKNIVNEIKKFDMAICNTIATDKYARVCSSHIPTVWYIREATNIPDFIRNNPDRLYTLKHSRSICCVSDYAAEAIAEYTNHKVMIVHNCVEDEVEMAVPYVCGSAEKVRFVQFGTIEFRKGYDVLLAAYQALPEEYRDKSELYFAGGFINSGTPFCDYLFSQMKGNSGVHYLGIVQGEENKIKTLSQMDVVVVASRDESCSLVALEGAMLSKPLIVTENVGAKYIINEKNGCIVKTADVESLKDAMMRLIDQKANLVAMGAEARKSYEELASMESYTQEMQKLFNLAEQKNTKRFACKKIVNSLANSSLAQSIEQKHELKKNQRDKPKTADVIVSLTSHPGRVHILRNSIQSLLNQNVKPRKVLLWLSKQQFSEIGAELPEEVLEFENNPIFEIRWVQEDLKPHKKYFYAMQEYPNLPVIICDDDVIYSPELVEKLMNSYQKFPDCVSAMRVNMMMFREDGTLRKYDGWIQGYNMLCDTPSYSLLPTGVGGVLYPPGAIPVEAFNAEAINQFSLFCDDLWLKMFASHNGYKTVLPSDRCDYEDIREARKTALWRINVNQNNNDVTMQSILEYYDRNLGDSKEWLRMIRKDRFC